MNILRETIVIVLLLFLSLNVCLADELILGKDTKYQQQVMKTGFRILNCNNIPKRITFFYNTENKQKLKINTRAKTVTIYKGLFPYIEDENELAALLSTGIATLIDMHSGFFRRFSISFSPRKYEVKSDKKAVDLMVNAGYDPVALINILNKTASQPSWFEYNIFVHTGKERTAYLYQYIYEKYPIYLADNRYLKTLYYQNFLLNSKDKRKMIRMIQEERLRIKEEKEKQENNI
ncbi:MAG: hypothetical protein KHX03_00610 [Clostridium sp.]|nr:hypothetical protein [Clostridium sp.]